MPHNENPPGNGGGDPHHQAAGHTTYTSHRQETGTRESSAECGGGYRYDLPGGRRRVRPPRSKAYCAGCRTLIGVESLNANGSCECCARQLPLFPIPDPNGASQW